MCRTRLSQAARQPSAPASRTSSRRARHLRLTERVDVHRHDRRLADEPLDGEERHDRGTEIEVGAPDFPERAVLQRTRGVEQAEVRAALLDAQRRALEILPYEWLDGGVQREEPVVDDLLGLAHILAE